jgi:aryl-alcohol dehydrogenase-like predicted oxidoreductase
MLLHNFLFYVKLHYPNVPLTMFHYLLILSAFVLSHPRLASAIFGATKLWQLDEVLKASKINLPEGIFSEINDVHARYPNPCP